MYRNDLINKNCILPIFLYVFILYKYLCLFPLDKGRVEVLYSGVNNKVVL